MKESIYKILHAESKSFTAQSLEAFVYLSYIAVLAIFWIKLSG